MENQFIDEQAGSEANEFFKEKIEGLMSESQKVLVGQDEHIKLALICLLCEGHVLLEGAPGIAKTLTARVFAKLLSTDFKRIQFTPDLLPADIIGNSVFNMESSSFSFKKGPLFSNVVLIDEINRSPAKTQSALFEAMGEKQITNDGVSHRMKDPFIVMATQNPIEQEGTYRLPEAQLDRFLMKIILDYPSESDELEILKRFKNHTGYLTLSEVNAVLNNEDIDRMRDMMKNVVINDQILNYITKIVQNTRDHAKLFLGASPRASLALLMTSKANALLEGREFVIPEDIKYMAPFVLNHRIILSPESEMEGITSFKVIEEIIHDIEVPR